MINMVRDLAFAMSFLAATSLASAAVAQMAPTDTAPKATAPAAHETRYGPDASGGTLGTNHAPSTPADQVVVLTMGACCPCWFQPICCRRVYCRPVCCQPVCYQPTPCESCGTVASGILLLSTGTANQPTRAPDEPSNKSESQPSLKSKPPNKVKPASIAVPANNLAMSVRANPSAESGVALFTVSVPEDAKVIVNGKPTKSTGVRREYYLESMENGATYTFLVVAQVYRDGQKVEKSETLVLRPGDVKALAIDLPAPTQVASLSTR